MKPPFSSSSSSGSTTTVCSPPPIAPKYVDPVVVPGSGFDRCEPTPGSVIVLPPPDNMGPAHTAQPAFMAALAFMAPQQQSPTMPQFHQMQNMPTMHQMYDMHQMHQALHLPPVI